MTNKHGVLNFQWETLLRNESELLRRGRVPNGWLVSHLLRGDPPIPPSLTFVPDENHAWVLGQDPRGLETQSLDAARADAAGRFDGDSSSALKDSALEVVSKGAAGVVTTRAEVDCYNAVTAIVRAARPELELNFLDTPTYFGIYLGSPLRWIARLLITSTNSWVALNLGEEDVGSVTTIDLPKRLPGNWASEIRYALNRTADLHALAPLIIKAVDKLQ